MKQVLKYPDPKNHNYVNQFCLRQEELTPLTYRTPPMETSAKENLEEILKEDINQTNLKFDTITQDTTTKKERQNV